jgi:hypothetical protein
MSEEARTLIAFIATLAAVCFLSKVGGTGADLAIMTGLIGILGMLAQSFRKGEKKTDVTNANVEEQNVNQAAQEERG